VPNFIILPVHKSYRPTVNEYTKYKPIRCSDTHSLETGIARWPLARCTGRQQLLD